MPRPQQLTDEEQAEYQRLLEAEDRQALIAAQLHTLIPRRYLDRAEPVTATHPQAVAWADQVTREHAAQAARNHQDRHSPRNRYLPPEYAPRPAGPSLLLLGPVGTGKTHQAYGALRRIVEHGNRATTIRAITAANLYARLRPRQGADPESEFDRHADADILLLDDLGVEKSSTWTEATLSRLIDHRYTARLATVLTSNVPPAHLTDQLGERVASRLLEMCDVATMTGPDRRRQGHSS